MADELYVDGIGNVAITGMVIRFDLMAIDTSRRDEKNQPQPTARQQVIMPIDGFLRMFQSLGGTVSKLEELGVIRKNRKPESAADVDPAEVTKKVLDSALKTGFNSDGKPAEPK